MSGPSFPVFIREDEYGECGGYEATQGKVTVASSLDCRTSSELQMTSAVKVLLQAIGEDVEREGILKTPLRVAKAFQSFFSGYELTPEGVIGGALFTEAGTNGGTGGGSGGMVVVRNIFSFAMCDTCLLPFRLRTHVAYIPSGQRVVGLSKLPRVVNMLSRRLQNPQKLANEVVQALYDTFEPLGVAVAVESWHLEWPGSRETNGGAIGDCAEDRLGFGWVPTIVSAARGKFENVQSSLWDEFLGIVELDGIGIGKLDLGATNSLPAKDKSCPFFSYSGKAECLACVSALALAVESLLRAEGEHVSPQELQITASRYVNWLRSATQGSNQKLLHGNVIDVEMNGIAVHSSANGCCNQPRTVSGADVHQASAVGVVNNHHSYRVGVNCRLTNGSVNGYSNGISHGISNGEHSIGVHHGVTNGTLSVYSNGISHGVSAVQSIGEYSNGVKHGIQNVTVTSYSDGVNRGVGNGFISDVQSSDERCDGRYYEVPNGFLNGSNGLSHGVSKGDADGVQNIGEQMKGSVRLGMSFSSYLNDHADSRFSSELDLPLSSLCEHHLLPFFGVVHLGYVGGRFRLERSLLLKIVRMFSSRLQVQERLTKQIAESIASLADFQWVMVVVEANHMCIVSRGAEKFGSTTATVATTGELANDGAMRAAFLKRISRRVSKRTISLNI